MTVSRQGQGRPCGSGTPYELEEVGIKLAVTADSFTGGTDDDGVKGFADIGAFF
jgi:hypothetical protein